MITILRSSRPNEPPTMGRVITSVTLTNVLDRSKSFRCDAMVDTGATFMVLPAAWKERLGELEQLEEVQVETATQATVRGELCGPVEIQIEGFRRIHTEVMFIDMQPENCIYEPLLGYVVLEQSQAAVDRVGHRLMNVPKADLK